MKYHNLLIHLNVEKMAKAYGVSLADKLRKLTDGRMIGLWTEQWIANGFGLHRPPSLDTAKYDLVDLENGSLYSVKTAKKVKLQQSRYVGSGRKCTKQNIVDSLDGIAGHFVAVQNTGRNIWMAYLDGDMMHEAAMDNELKSSGNDRSEIYRRYVSWDKSNWILFRPDVDGNVLSRQPFQWNPIKYPDYEPQPGHSNPDE